MRAAHGAVGPGHTLATRQHIACRVGGERACGRRTAAHESREQTDEPAKGQCSSVELRQADAEHRSGELCGYDRGQRVNPPPHHRRRGRGADPGEHKAFREQLPGDAPTCGAERSAHGNLSASCQRARQQQVRHVCATDGQQQSDGTKQARQHHPCRLPTLSEVLARAVPVTRLNLDTKWLPGSVRPRQQRIQFPLRVVDGQSGTHACDDLARFTFRCGQPCIRLTAHEVPKRRRHHADDHAHAAGKRHCRPNHLRIAIERAAPVRVADDDAAAGRDVVVGEVPAELRGDAKKRRKSRGERADTETDLRAVGQRETPRIAERRRTFEYLWHRAYLVDPTTVHPDPHTGAGHGFRDPQQVHEPIGIPVGQRPQQGGVHDAEDDGARADAEGERDHGHGGEARGAHQAAAGVANVTDGVRQPGQAALVAERVHGGRDAAGSDDREARGVGRRVPPAPQFVRFDGEVGFELVLQIPIGAAPPERRTHSTEHVVEQSHRRLLLAMPMESSA